MLHERAIPRFATALAPAVEPQPAEEPIIAQDPGSSSSPTASEPQENLASSSGSSKRRRRLAALLTPVIVIGITIGAHWLWTWQGERRLTHYVKGLKDGGEKVALADFLPAGATPDERNAAVDIRTATESLSGDGEMWQDFFGIGPLGFPLTEQELSVIRPVLDTNAKTIEMVRAAMSKPEVDWAGILPSQYRSPFPAMFFRGGGGAQRRGALGQLVGTAAMVAHQEGDDHMAVAHVHELLFLSRATGERPTVRGQFGAQKTCEMAENILDAIIPGISIGDGRNQAKPADVKSLIARLVDDGGPRDAMQRTLRVERARHLEGLLPPPGGPSTTVPWGDMPPPAFAVSRSIQQYLWRPVQLGRAMNSFERLSLAIGSFNAVSYREFLAAFTENPVVKADDAAAAAASAASGGVADDDGETAYLRGLTNNVQEFGRIHYLLMARRKTSALALAVQLYRAEHNAWPAANLMGLVPQYLSAIPLDPLSTTADRLVYIPDAKRPRVYSVGEDGIDDGGWPPEPFATRAEDMRLSDYVVDLKPQPRKGPARRG
jgi:hypothetical protein